MKRIQADRTVALGIAVLFVASLVIVVAVPLWWTIMTSFKGPAEVFTRPYALLPESFALSSYRAIFASQPFARYLVNTVKIAVAVCAGTLVTSSMAGYAFARLRFPGRDIVFLVYLATLMVPRQVTLVPNFILFRVLGLIDTHWPLVLTGIFSAYGTFLVRQFLLTIPRELEEAALIDGYGYGRIFVHVILPLSKSALITLLIVTLLMIWNEYLFALVFISDPMKRTLTLGLALLRGDMDIQWNLVTAATVVSVTPIVAVYLFAQRFFIEGIALSGLKG